MKKQEDKNASFELERYRRQLSDAGRLAKLGFWEWSVDLNGDQATYCSHELAKILGMSPDEYVSLDDPLEEISSLVHPDDRDQYKKNYKQSLISGESYEIAFRVVLKDGTTKYLIECGETVFGEDGDPVRLFGTVQDVTESKIADDALRLAEARYKRASEIAKLGHWVWDNISNTPLYTSEETAAIYGLTLEEYNSNISSFEDVLELVHPDDREPYKLASLNLFQNNANYEIIIRLVLPGGIIRHVKEFGEAVLDDEGQLIQTVGTALDVSGIVNLEQGLRDRDFQIEQALMLADMGAWIWDSIKQEYEYVSPQLAEIYGYSVEEYLDLAKTEDQSTFKVHPEDQEQHSDLVDDHERRGEGYQATYRIVRRDGFIRTIRETNQPIFDDTGKILKSIGCVQDITHFTQTEDALRMSENRLSEILDIAPEAVITIGSDMKIQVFNKGAERIFGYSNDEIIGQPMEILMPERLRQGHHRHIDDFSSSPSIYRYMDQRVDIVGLRKDGTEFPASASVSKLQDRGEQIYTVMLHDVTIRRRNEDDRQLALSEAKKANRAKSEFLANMSHELRTPLNAIIGFSGMLMEGTFGTLGAPKNSESIASINAAGTHLLQIIGDILDISKIEAGEAIVEDTLINVGKSLEDCIVMVKVRARESKVSLVVDKPENLPALRADERHLKQILLNLLSNAIKFTPVYGKVTVNIRTNNDLCVEISVSDTGIGIAPSDIEKVLQPFGQVAESHKRNHSGTGLGLPICKSLMELHDGRIIIESMPGVGTTVTVRFPPERTLHAQI